MPNMPTQPERVAELLRQNAGKQVTRDYLQKTVPEEKSIVVFALVVNDGTEDAVKIALGNHADVNICLEVGRQRTPDWTPEDQEWEARVTFIGGHRMIPTPPPE